MSTSDFTESVVEQAALAWLESLRYGIAFGPTIAPEQLAAERVPFDDVVLARRVREALARLNPGATPDTLDEAFRRITRVGAADAVGCNRAFHGMLVDGLTVEQKRPDGSIAGVIVRLADFDDPDNN